MKLYIDIIREAIDYIEENMKDNLTLQMISSEFYISEFHFSRLFKIITGVNLKQYILGRKLSRAAEILRTQSGTVTKAALEYGFEYPEVFSRAFKKLFGMSPLAYKKGDFDISLTPKATVFERDLMNIKGTFTIKETTVYYESFRIYGVSVEVNENSHDFTAALNNTGGSFMLKFSKSFSDGKLYSVVNCHEDDIGEYTVHFGAVMKQEQIPRRLMQRIIPAGWYAVFQYNGDMLAMRTTFIEDLYRWIVMKDMELASNGIGMINIFDIENVHNVQILVPIIVSK